MIIESIRASVEPNDEQKRLLSKIKIEIGEDPMLAATALVFKTSDEEKVGYIQELKQREHAYFSWYGENNGMTTFL